MRHKTDSDKKEVVNIPQKHLPSKPHTKEEIHDDASERVSLITEEFKTAFAFLKKYPKSVTIFGGSHFHESDEEYHAAKSLAARIVTEIGYSVFTGGGPGIMEAANRGAYEAGGESLGFTIELPHLQIKNDYLTRSLDFHYFFSRKVGLSFSAEAYVFFPGGFGTMDEFFEIITLVQTKKIEKVPVILFGTSFWQPLHEFMKKEMLYRGAVDENDMSLYTITNDESHVLEIIKDSPIHKNIKFTRRDLEGSGIVIDASR